MTVLSHLLEAGFLVLDCHLYMSTIPSQYLQFSLKIVFPTLALSDARITPKFSLYIILP